MQNNKLTNNKIIIGLISVLSLLAVTIIGLLLMPSKNAPKPIEQKPKVAQKAETTTTTSQSTVSETEETKSAETTEVKKENEEVAKETTSEKETTVESTNTPNYHKETRYKTVDEEETYTEYVTKTEYTSEDITENKPVYKDFLILVSNVNDPSTKVHDIGWASDTPQETVDAIEQNAKELYENGGVLHTQRINGYETVVTGTKQTPFEKTEPVTKTRTVSKQKAYTVYVNDNDPNDVRTEKP